jgi:hypothetical protein
VIVSFYSPIKWQTRTKITRRRDRQRVRGRNTFQESKRKLARLLQ